jgi:hypothetical protein
VLEGLLVVDVSGNIDKNTSKLEWTTQILLHLVMIQHQLQMKLSLVNILEGVKISGYIY